MMPAPSPVFDSHGKIVSYISINRDVTHETELQNQLNQSQKMEALGKLASEVAHDFNNVLHAVGNYAQLILRYVADGEKIKAYSEIIVKNVNHATLLTRQLADFGRKSSPENQWLNPNDKITETHQMLGALVDDDIEIALTLAPEIRRIKVDPTQFGQVIMNLVVNAKDALPNGGEIKIKTQNIEISRPLMHQGWNIKPGSYIQVSVADTGTGIESALIPHIFEPFYTGKERGKGTGLGLAIVYGFIKQVEGDIKVSSARGQGTTFDLFIPAGNSE